jgi:hypothetical protein
MTTKRTPPHDPGFLSRFFGSLRRALARFLAPDEVGRPDDLVALIATPKGDGVWALDRKGNIFAFGKAPEFREVPQPQPWRPGSFVAMASTPSGQGLWTLDRSGNILAFGDAPEFREIPQPEPWRPGSFVGMASTPSGRGVWLLERGGRILSFGDAAELWPTQKR